MEKANSEPFIQDESKPTQTPSPAVPEKVEDKEKKLFDLSSLGNEKKEVSNLDPFANENQNSLVGGQFAAGHGPAPMSNPAPPTSGGFQDPFGAPPTTSNDFQFESNFEAPKEDKKDDKDWFNF
jgi:hypothetical protein